MKINIFWFRRDLRLEDNTGLDRALNEGLPVLPLFIFDTNIISELPEDDARISFIYKSLSLLNNEFRKTGSSISIYKGDPEEIWKILTGSFQINTVFTNRDYEPYGISRDKAVNILLREKNITFLSFKDQVIFEGSEILKPDNKPYTIFTPYKKRWLQKFNDLPVHIDKHIDLKTRLFYKHSSPFPFLEDIGFRQSQIKVKPFNLKAIHSYDKYRDYPFEEKTSLLSPYLRFGITSIRSIIKLALTENPVFLNELIWREFFMQILYHFPHIVSENFKSSYDDIQWRNNEGEFERWCNGETGYPIVDAGMRQLNKTGFMHNRIRMITAGFLCKHLLIDWRWGGGIFCPEASRLRTLFK